MCNCQVEFEDISRNLHPAANNMRGHPVDTVSGYSRFEAIKYRFSISKQFFFHVFFIPEPRSKIFKRVTARDGAQT